MYKMSVVIVTYQRKEDLRENLLSLINQKYSNFEIILIDNASTDGTKEMILDEFPNITYYYSDVNLGVAGGRNLGTSLANGEIIVFLDDDAIVQTEDTLRLICDKFINSPKLGVLAFKIVNYYSHKILKHEFPHPDITKFNEEMFVGYYVGAGHAIRKEVLEKTGLLPEDYFYGLEELDLSYRVIENGYNILYCPDVAIYHKVSKKGRHSKGKYIYYGIRNRYKIVAKYLPLRYGLVYIFIWSIYLLLISIKVRDIGSFFKGVCDGLNEFRRTCTNEDRNVLSASSIKTIKNVQGRLFV